MGTGQGVLIETLAGGGLAAGFVAVKDAMPAKLRPEPDDGAIAALASRQDSPAALAWWW